MKSNGRTVHCQSKIRGTFLMHIQTIMLFHIALFTWLWASSAVFFLGSLLGSASPPSNLSPWSPRSTPRHCRRRSSCRLRIRRDYRSLMPFQSMISMMTFFGLILYTCMIIYIYIYKSCWITVWLWERKTPTENPNETPDVSCFLAHASLLGTINPHP